MLNKSKIYKAIDDLIGKYNHKKSKLSNTVLNAIRDDMAFNAALTEDGKVVWTHEFIESIKHKFKKFKK